jgi:hypothetical protein
MKFKVNKTLESLIPIEFTKISSIVASYIEEFGIFFLPLKLNSKTFASL